MVVKKSETREWVDWWVVFQFETAGIVGVGVG